MHWKTNKIDVRGQPTALRKCVLGSDPNKHFGAEKCVLGSDPNKHFGAEKPSAFTEGPSVKFRFDLRRFSSPEMKLEFGEAPRRRANSLGLEEDALAWALFCGLDDTLDQIVWHSCHTL